MIARILHWIRQIVILPIRIYQGTISRITPATCRFRPTCSQYAVESIENRGVIVGGLYTCWRLLRCNPFVKGGWDFPPTPKDGSQPEQEHAHDCGSNPAPEPVAEDRSNDPEDIT
jgi:putative membrane protein insertion efficiency factor